MNNPDPRTWYESSLPTIVREFADRHGEESLLWLGTLSILITKEVDAERYEWAAFWRDEAIYLFSEDTDA